MPSNSLSDKQRDVDLAALRALIATGDPVTMRQPDRLGRTPLMRAVSANDPELVRQLIAHSNLDAMSSFGNAAQHIAAQHNQEECLRLLAPLCDLGQRTEKGSTALVLAATAGALPCLRVLVEEKSRRLEQKNVTVSSEGGRSEEGRQAVSNEGAPAEEEGKAPHKREARRLRFNQQSWASFEWLNDVSDAIDMAILNHRIECAEYLEDAMEWPLESLRSHSMFKDAIGRDNAAMVQSILAATAILQGAAPQQGGEATGTLGQTPRKQQGGVSEKEHQKDLDAGEPIFERESTPKERVKFGIATRKDIKRCLEEGIVLACARASTELVRIVCEHFLVLERPASAESMEALSEALTRGFLAAAKSGNSPVLKMFQEWMSSRTRTASMDTALGSARGAQEGRECWLSRNTVNAVNKAGCSALMLAAKGHSECVRILLETVGINCRQKDAQGWNAFDHALSERQWGCVDLLAHTATEAQRTMAMQQGPMEQLPRVAASLEQAALQRVLVEPQALTMAATTGRHPSEGLAPGSTPGAGSFANNERTGSSEGSMGDAQKKKRKRWFLRL